MEILDYIAVVAIISTVLLSFYNFNYLYHYNYRNSLSKLGVIALKQKTKSKNSDVVIGIILLNIAILVSGSVASAIYLYDINKIASIFMFSLWIMNFFALIFFEEIAEKPKRLIKYASKVSNTPSTILEFKIIAFLFANNEPSYLWDYKRTLGQTYPPNLEKDEKGYRDPVDIQYYFPLYIRLRDFQTLITNEAIDRDHPFINRFILENITFLTTIITILKDEQMVKTLGSFLGEKDLQELNVDFSKLNIQLNAICEYIKKEKITSKEVKDNLEMMTTLDEIRSMKNFSKLIK